MNPLQTLQHINTLAAFNRWCGIEVVEVGAGEATIRIQWREEFGQYSGFLHAGLVATLIDTACGYAATTVAGPHLLASNFTVNCLRPATGHAFTARASVVKAGKSQVFTGCNLWAHDAEGDKLVANGQTLLSVMSPAPKT